MKNFIQGANIQYTLVFGMAVLAVFALFTGVFVPRAAHATVTPCVMVLGSGANVVQVTGSSKITASGCGLTVVSATTPAVLVTGSSNITAGVVCAKSTSITGSSKISPSATSSCASATDPFASVPLPAAPACNYTNLSYTNSSTNTLHPGVYCGNTTLGGSTKETFAPGVYIFKNGTLTINGSATATATGGVVLFFTGNGGSLQIGGSAKLSIVAPSSGPLAGFAIYLDPAASPAAASSVVGSTQLTVSGITYLPKQTLSIEGSSKVVASGDATFVLGKISVTGSSNLTASGAIPLPPPSDTQAPVIASHADISVIGTSAGATVSYTSPTAIDNVDGTDAVTCLPASGTVFAVGTTTVTCNAHDAANNNATPTTFSVGVSVPAPTDTEAPVIAPHADISFAGPHLNQSAAVNYTNPIATDNVDGTDAVTCLPASGSTFAFGTTTVTCNSQDAAGNHATATTFNVGVYFIPQPYVMASQPDESFLCAPDWEVCFAGGNSTAKINLGQGSVFGNGTLHDIAIAKDPSSPFVSQAWILQLNCFTDSGYTTACPDWVSPQAWNSNQTNVLAEFTSSSADNTHWVADFTNPSHARNNDGSSPVIFNPAYYYQLTINDNGWNTGAYGSQSLAVPYYTITGMTK